MGKLELSVPQARGTEPYSPMFFAKWQRSERALLVACAEMYYPKKVSSQLNAVV
jgi:hypothetical protein